MGGFVPLTQKLANTGDCKYQKAIPIARGTWTIKGNRLRPHSLEFRWLKLTSKELEHNGKRQRIYLKRTMCLERIEGSPFLRTWNQEEESHKDLRKRISSQFLNIFFPSVVLIGPTWVTCSFLVESTVGGDWVTPWCQHAGQVLVLVGKERVFRESHGLDRRTKMYLL